MNLKVCLMVTVVLAMTCMVVTYAAPAPVADADMNEDATGNAMLEEAKRITIREGGGRMGAPAPPAPDSTLHRNPVKRIDWWGAGGTHIAPAPPAIQ